MGPHGPEDSALTCPLGPEEKPANGYTGCTRSDHPQVLRKKDRLSAALDPPVPGVQFTRVKIKMHRLWSPWGARRAGRACEEGRHRRPGQCPTISGYQGGTSGRIRCCNVRVSTTQPQRSSKNKDKTTTTKNVYRWWLLFNL